MSSEPKTLRTGALASGFDAAPSSLRAQMWNQAVFYFDATLDTATDIRVRFDVTSKATSNPSTVLEADPAANDAEWRPICATDTVGTTVASGVMSAPLAVYELVIATSGSYTFPLPINYKWLRAKAKATGTVGNATLTIRATVGMA